VQEWTQQWLEKGRQQGRQEGRQEGEAELLLRMIERRFGPLSAADRARIQRADAGALLIWGDRLLSARSLAEVFVD
jgi:predicted transposase YdaD